ncbi:MAG: glucosylglycerol hydrolase [Balneolaceae bacterium]
MMNIVFNEQETNSFSERLRKKLRYGIKSSNAEFLARNLGAHINNNFTRFLFWHPVIETAEQIVLELFIPPVNLIFDKPEQHTNFTCYTFQAKSEGAFACAVVNHLPSGNRAQFGAFYQLAVIDKSGERKVVRDPMASSLPYGIYAPAELYDINSVLKSRSDKGYYHQLREKFLQTNDNRVSPPVNLLEIHTGTTTKEGTLRSLTKRYKQIDKAINRGMDLSPDEKNLIGFDAVELMPVDPVIQHPENHNFWKPIQTPPKTGSEITIYLRKPNVTNWGYDSVIFGAAAVNPSLLTTGRPHELLELIETLHNFPGQPIKVVLDVVFGHAHNQAQNLLPADFFSGPGMYGQSINYRHPLVRAMILELLRRKMNWGFDGIRVDGAQDFKYDDESSGKKLHDNEFLNEISNINQEVAGLTFKPWMIFEDARPWPREDWMLSSTYRDITLQQEHSFQWAPTIFAYNTPYTFTYWISRWWRISEMVSRGGKWISGYANHDTIRRATQSDPAATHVNTMLGNSLKMIMENAYNNPATTLLMNGFMPGVPMDFVHALGSTPWSFIRNTDTEYALKIMAGEAHFTEWQITEVEYRSSRFFKRLKDFGFQSLTELRRFSSLLQHFVQAAGYNSEVVANLLNNVEPAAGNITWDSDKLTRFTVAWMDDLHDYCNTDMHADYVDPQKAEFNLKVRKFRLQNPWLAGSFSHKDILAYRKPVDGTVIYYGYRREPEGKKEIVYIANMEGNPRQVIPSELGLPIQISDDWEIALATPTIKPKSIQHSVRLAISQGILYLKNS